MGGGVGARINLDTELILSLLSCEGALSSIVDSLVHENFSGGKTLDFQSDMIYL